MTPTTTTPDPCCTPSLPPDDLRIAARSGNCDLMRDYLMAAAAELERLRGLVGITS